MTKSEAKAILNRVREGSGAETSVELIRAALYATGDLRVDAPVRSEGLDTSVPRACETVWHHAGETVVAEDLRGFRAYSWSRRFGRLATADER